MFVVSVALVTTVKGQDKWDRGSSVDSVEIGTMKFVLVPSEKSNSPAGNA